MRIPSLIFFFILLCACSKQKELSKASPQSSKEVLRLNFTTDPYSIDPAYGFESKSQLLIRALFEGLTRIGTDGKVYPAVAEKIEISPDKKVYTFTLRDCVWTNGEPVLATDFVHAWKRILASDSDATLCDLLYILKNARSIKEKLLPIESLGVEVLDPKVLRVELEHPAGYFLYLLSNPIYSPVCRKIDLENPNWNQKKDLSFISNGPFRLKLWEPSKSLVIEKNPFYYDADSVELQEVSFHFVNDPYTVLLMFEKGELDWVGDPWTKLPLEALPALQKNNQLQMHPIAGLYWLVCNTEQFPLNSSKIRKALSYAINRQTLTDNVLIGQRVAISMVPESLSCLSKIEQLKDENVEIARRLFEEGLEELGITREEFPTLTLGYTTVSGYKPVAEIIQQQWKKNLNIETELQCTEWNIYIQNFLKKQFEIAPVGWNSFFEDPIYHLQTFKYKVNASNWASWENEEYQKLLDCADEEIDDLKRKGYLKKAEQILLDEMPVIPLCCQTYKFIKNDKIDKFLITDLGEIDLKWISFKDQER